MAPRAYFPIRSKRKRYGRRMRRTKYLRKRRKYGKYKTGLKKWRVGQYLQPKICYAKLRFGAFKKLSLDLNTFEQLAFNTATINTVDG